MKAPDIGALVEYGLDSFGKEPGRFRVSAWMRWVLPSAPSVPTDPVAASAFRLISEILPERKPRWEFCLQHEATHLALSGIAGAIAPIEAVKVTGMVSWSKEHLDDALRSALALAGRASI